MAVTVSCVDDDPVAVDDTATVAEDSGATAIDVLANDTDVDGGAEHDRLGHPARPRHRRGRRRRPVAHLPAQRQLLQRPGTPTDDFTYTLNGGSTATVRVTVNCVDDAPVAVDDTATVAEDSGATAIDVLGQRHRHRRRRRSRSPRSPSPPTAPSWSPATHLALTYQPNADYCNDGTPTDDFTYTADTAAPPRRCR